jgi:hypothetical protein
MKTVKAMTRTYLQLCSSRHSSIVALDSDDVESNLNRRDKYSCTISLPSRECTHDRLEVDQLMRSASSLGEATMNTAFSLTELLTDLSRISQSVVPERGRGH